MGDIRLTPSTNLLDNLSAGASGAEQKQAVRRCVHIGRGVSRYLARGTILAGA
jgi:hypothetical protein